MKANDLMKRVKQSLEELDEMSQEARSTTIREWLAFQARFHKYSFHNTLLIKFQRPDATMVAGFRAWQKMGRRVRKGEKGIAILVPRIRIRVRQVEGPDGVTELEEEEVYFVTGYVFDVSQTEGEPLPKPRTVPVGDGGAELIRRLEALCAQRGIKVDTRPLPKGKLGVSLGGEIALSDTLSPLGRAAVLAHELAHEILHQIHRLPREVEEVEAEAVAYVVLTHFGFAPREMANYVGLWDQDGKILRERMERIATVAREIIEAIEAIEIFPQDAELRARWDRARQALSSGDYQIHRNGPRSFIVSNNKKGREYVVEFPEGSPLGICTCPDYVRRGKPCKHVAMTVLKVWPQAADRWLALVEKNGGGNNPGGVPPAPPAIGSAVLGVQLPHSRLAAFAATVLPSSTGGMGRGSVEQIVTVTKTTNGGGEMYAVIRLYADDVSAAAPDLFPNPEEIPDDILAEIASHFCDAIYAAGGWEILREVTLAVLEARGGGTWPAPAVGRER